MNTKTIIALTGTVITAVLLFAYVTLRSGMIEKEYARGLIPVSDRIAFHLKNFEPEKELRAKNLSRFLETAGKKFQPVAVLAIADRSGALLGAGRNSRYMPQTESFDSAIQSFTRGDFQVKGASPFAVRYYDRTKYYVFVKELPESRMLVLFPYKLRGKLLVKLLLELLLIAILSVIFTTAFYLYLRRSGKVRREAAYRVISPRKTAGENRIAGRISKGVEDSLHGYVFELFTYIRGRYAAGPISLHVMSPDTPTLEKLYEMKGEAFIKIDTAGFERMDISNEIGEEMRRSSIMVLDAGKKLIIPVLHRNALLAAIRIERDTPFLGPEMKDIRINAQRITRALSEYVLMNDIVVDPGSGLLSAAYFQMKYDELLARNSNDGVSFGILLISIFRPGSDLDDAQKNLVLRGVSGELAGAVRENAVIARHGDDIAMLLPESSREETAALASRLKDELSRVKIQLGRKQAFDIVPQTGISATGTTREGSDPLREALSDLQADTLLHDTTIPDNNDER